MPQDAGFTVWSSAVRCLLIVLLLEKEKGRGGGVAGGGGRRMSEIRGTPAAMSGCSTGCAVKRGKERERGRVVSSWLCCTVQSGLGALLTAQDWWIELCIAHNINSVLLSLSFWVSLPHHSSLPLSLLLSLLLSLPPRRCSRSLAGPSLPY